jgi:hypothetical protein
VQLLIRYNTPVSFVQLSVECTGINRSVVPCRVKNNCLPSATSNTDIHFIGNELTSGFLRKFQSW